MNGRLGSLLSVPWSVGRPSSCTHLLVCAVAIVTWLLSAGPISQLLRRPSRITLKKIGPFRRSSGAQGTPHPADAHGKLVLSLVGVGGPCVSDCWLGFRGGHAQFSHPYLSISIPASFGRRSCLDLTVCRLLLYWLPFVNRRSSSPFSSVPGYRRHSCRMFLKDSNTRLQSGVAMPGVLAQFGCLRDCSGLALRVAQAS